MVRQKFLIHLYWACCLFYSSGSKLYLFAVAANATNKNFRGSTGTKRSNGSSQRLPVAKGGMTRKKEDKWNSQKAGDFTKNPSESPSVSAESPIKTTTEPSSSPTEAPSAPPSQLPIIFITEPSPITIEENTTPPISQSILKPNTSNPTITPISSPPTSKNNINADLPEDDKETDASTTVELLPFSLVIDGSLEDEFYIREELQYYLLDYYWEQEEPEFIVSIKLETISHTFLLNEKEPDRNLQQQLPQTPSTVTTFLEYEGRAIIKRSKQEETVDGRSQNDIETIHDIQIESLENTVELQQHFLKWFTLQHIVADEIDKNPVVLVEVQVDDRPPKHIDSKETWHTIESIIDDDPNVSSTNQNNNASIDDERGINDEIDINNNKTQQKTPTASNTPDQIVDASSSNNDSYTWKVTISIGCVMMILAGIGGIFFIWREKRHRYQGQFVKGTLSRELDNHAVEVISDADSDEQMESVLYEKSILRSDSDESKERLLFFLPNFLIFRKRIQTKKFPSTENEYNIEINDTTTDNASSSNNINFVSRKHEAPSLGTSQSTGIDLTVPARNSKGFEDVTIEKEISNERQRGNSGYSKRSSFTFSPISFLHQQSSESFVDNITSKNERSIALQHDPDETDFVASRMNIYTVTSNDDDSMMGYSLTSHEGESVSDRSKSHKDLNNEYNNDEHHEGIAKKYRSDECHSSESDIGINRYNKSNNDGQDLNDSMHITSSRTPNSFRNPLFAGINKFLDVPNHSNNSRPDANIMPPKNKSQHQDQRDRSRGFVENVTTLDVKPSNNISDRKNEDVQLVTTMLNIHEADDETASSYKVDDSAKGDMSSVLSEFSPAGISDNDLKCHDMLSKNTLATPLEEIRDGSFLLPMRESKSIFSSTLVDILTLDDVSDAPSDERNNSRSASRMLSSKVIANSSLLDNDPTLIDHIVKEQ